MEKNEILKEANEALQRTLLMMNYDMKKTLTENVEVISEQAMSSQDICNLMYNGAHGSIGTKEDVLVKAFSSIKNIQQYNEVNKCYGESGKEKSLQDMLKSEMDSSDKDTLDKIKNSLSKIGITLSYKETTNFMYGVPTKVIMPDSITISYGKTTPATTTPKTTTPTTAQKTTTSPKTTAPKATKVVDKNILDKLNFEYTLPGDKNYVYDFIPEGFMNEQTTPVKGTWYAKNVKTGQVFDLTNLPKAVQKLDAQWGQAKNPIDKIPDTAKQETPQTTQTQTQTDVDTGKPGNESIPDSQIQGKKLEVQPVKTDMSAKNISVPQRTTVPKKQSLLAKLRANKPKKTTTQPTQTVNPQTPSTTGFERDDTALESIKTSLKMNLSEIKTKKENVLIESKIIKNRFNFLIEGKEFNTSKKQDALVESIILELNYLLSQGYDKETINEGFIDSFFNMLGGVMGMSPQVLGEWIAQWLLKKFGVAKDSYFGGVITAFVTSMNVSEYSKILTDCRFTSNKLADALMEGYLIKVQNNVGGNEGFSGFLISAMRNSIMEWLAEDKDGLIQKLEDKIADYLCPALSKVVGKISDESQAMKTKLAS